MVLLTVLDQLDHRWNMLLENGLGPLAVEYRQRCLLTGKTVTVQQAGGKLLVGMCRGIDDRGLLRLHSETGELAVASGTILKWA